MQIVSSIEGGLVSTFQSNQEQRMSNIGYKPVNIKELGGMKMQHIFYFLTYLQLFLISYEWSRVFPPFIGFGFAR